MRKFLKAFLFLDGSDFCRCMYTLGCICIYMCVCVHVSVYFHILVSVIYSKNHEFKEFLLRASFLYFLLLMIVPYLRVHRMLLAQLKLH